MLGRSVRTSQPQGPARIDWSNPITRGVIGSAIPYRENGVTLNPAVSQKTTPYGAVASTPSISNPITFKLSRAVGLGDMTIVCAHVPSDQSGTQVCMGMTSGADIWMGISSGSVVFSTPSTISAGFGVKLNELNVLVGRRMATVCSAFSNGKTSGATSTNSQNIQATFCTIGSYGGFGFSWPSSYLLGLVFDRALSDAEIKSLSDNPWQIFAPDSKALWTPAAASVTLPTLVQPNATTSAGAWTATGAATLHDAINELVASDTQYISVNSASTTELLLAESAYPGAANQTLAYRASSTQGSTLTVTLKQGATQIMTRTHALTGTDTLYTQTLTAPEIALITAGPISVTLTTS